MKKILLFVLIGVFCAIQMAFAVQQARVTGDRVNLRSRPDLSGGGEVVGQVNYGDVLTVKSVSNEWVEVAAPASVDLWVKREYIEPDNTVGAKRLRVRAGPGINYTDVDIVPGGVKLNVREQGDAPGDWVRIAPTDGASLWIFGEYVELQDAPPVEEKPEEAPPPPKKKPRGRPKKTAANMPPVVAAEEAAVAVAADVEIPEAAAAEPVKTADEVLPAEQAPIRTPQIAPSIPEGDPATDPNQIVPMRYTGRETHSVPPADLQLIPLEGQGKVTVIEGEVRVAPLFTEAPARYRIVHWNENQWKILGHLYGDPSKYRPYQNKKVEVEGYAYWIQKASAPVIVPIRISPVVVPVADDVLPR